MWYTTKQIKVGDSQECSHPTHPDQVYTKRDAHEGGVRLPSHTVGIRVKSIPKNARFIVQLGQVF